jgi:large subunit ribosomal protein L13
MNQVTIDASNKKLGRVASEAARILIGKDRTDFARNKIPNVEVTITNAAQLSLSEIKKESKKYPWYSGHPGGLRFETLKHAIEKKGYGEVIRRTVYGMLPMNKLRSRMIKNLKVKE